MKKNRSFSLFRIIIYTCLLIFIGISISSLAERFATIRTLKKEYVQLNKTLKKKNGILKVMKDKIKVYKYNPNVVKYEATKDFLMINNNESLIILKK